jgi:malate permease and related proteins
LANINTQFLLSLFIIMIGYIGKKLNLVKEEDGDGISRIIFNITLPALVINTFSTIKITHSLILLPFILIVYSFFIAFLGIFVFKKESPSNKGALSMTSVGFNIGLFAYPLVEALWGKEGLKYFGMLDMGNALIIYGLCFFLASYYSSNDGKINPKDILKKMGRSIPLLAYILTLLLHLFGLSYPKIVLDLSSTLSRANMPLSLLVLGIFLSLKLDKSYWISMLKSLLLRYGVGLAVGLILYFVLPFEPLFRITVLIGLVLPISMSTTTYSVEFNFDKKLVGTLTNLTIIVSFILIWILGLLLK